MRYFFQITPFEHERTRDRIELIDTVEEQLMGYESLMGLVGEERNVEVHRPRNTLYCRKKNPFPQLTNEKQDQV